jgi:hypothetical protein
MLKLGAWLIRAASTLPEGIPEVATTQGDVDSVANR